MTLFLAAPTQAGVAEDVTVIMSTFNRACYIQDALDSLLNQTVRAGKILVVDDGSTDGTAAVMALYEGRVECLRQENAGKAAALNHALERVTGGYVWIFDDDDVAAPDALERLYALSAHPDCGFSYGSHDNFFLDRDGKVQLCSADVPEVMDENLFPALMERCFIFQGGMLVRRSCYDEVGAFDVQLVRSQDYDMLLRLSLRFKAVRVGGVMFHMRQHHGVRGTARKVIPPKRMEDTWRMYDAIIMDRVAKALTARDYLPRGAQQATSEETMLCASLQKFVIFGRKDMWTLAAAALRDYAAAANALRRTSLSPDEAAKFARVFDIYSRGLHSFAEGERVGRSLRILASRRLERAVRQALATPLPYILRLALRRKDWTTIRKAVAASGVLLGPAHAVALGVGVLRRILVARLAGDADTALERFRTAQLSTSRL